ncbi:hypothetical protein GUITHDRAFT_122062 [Guillardia theta CCMP2712]|uniref:Uncharacterized protein n=1 Tax=Guillardia theta (strain CCMP2712) TaxID=905079 RepID=L1I6P4_GUITC|nr:hypothetical protein GUITHDRAFT_122062 [Guillardia theta CCMP2712]EKX31747.1 hypothetical protein GUITHDRAFT_122062 [Guillardia theta CCMP2712]|eukprot:XP_005818727.1 hypothetical protein GUITHDRAFT_122062 [Guillardia theta CCMP2712]
MDKEDAVQEKTTFARTSVDLPRDLHKLLTGGFASLHVGMEADNLSDDFLLMPNMLLVLCMQVSCDECFVCKRCRDGRVSRCKACRPCLDCSDQRTIDIDLAGCRECGAIHRCDASSCPVSEENDSHVCLITGNCVRMKRFTRDEFMDSVVIMDLPEAMDREVKLLVEMREVKDKVEWILMSSTALQSFDQERGRMEQKHRHLMWKALREVKVQGKIPNLCEVMTKILYATNKIRVCSNTFQEDLRSLISERCTHSITRFLNMMGQRFKSVLSSLKSTVLIIGTLYLMRMGISMNNIILLPRIPQLQLLLPIETHLKSYFHVKCKSITEVENMIKMCLRGLSSGELERMGFTVVENGVVV